MAPRRSSRCSLPLSRGVRVLRLPPLSRHHPSPPHRRHTPPPRHHRCRPQNRRRRKRKRRSPLRRWRRWRRRPQLSPSIRPRRHRSKQQPHPRQHPSKQRRRRRRPQHLLPHHRPLPPPLPPPPRVRAPSGTHLAAGQPQRPVGGLPPRPPSPPRLHRLWRRSPRASRHRPLTAPQLSRSQGDRRRRQQSCRTRRRSLHLPRAVCARPSAQDVAAASRRLSHPSSRVRAHCGCPSIRSARNWM